MKPRPPVTTTRRPAKSPGGVPRPPAYVGGRVRDLRRRARRRRPTSQHESRSSPARTRPAPRVADVDAVPVLHLGARAVRPSGSIPRSRPRRRPTRSRCSRARARRGRCDARSTADVTPRSPVAGAEPAAHTPLVGCAAVEVEEPVLERAGRPERVDVDPQRHGIDGALTADAQRRAPLGPTTAACPSRTSRARRRRGSTAARRSAARCGAAPTRRSIPASSTSSVATSWRYRASASSRSRPDGVTSPRRTMRSRTSTPVGRAGRRTRYVLDVHRSIVTHAYGGTRWEASWIVSASRRATSLATSSSPGC